MSNSTKRQALAARSERHADFFIQDWMLQLMLVAAVVGAMIASALQLSGGAGF